MPRRHNPHGRASRLTDSEAASVLALLSLIAILWICIRPTDGEPFTGIRTCLLCGDESVPNIILNVALYVPLGFAVRWRTGSTALALLVGLCLSFAVETAQIWIPGRYTGLIDLGSNTAGAWWGAMLRRHLGAVLWPAEQVQRALTAAWAIVIAVVMALMAWLMVPIVPPGELFAAWTPSLGSYGLYTGRVLSADIERVPLPAAGPVTASDLVRGLFSSRSDVHVRLEVGLKATQLAPVLHVTTASNADVLFVGAESHAVVVRPRLRAQQLGFSAPELKASGALLGYSQGDTVSVVVSLGGATQDFELSIDGAVAGSGWSAARGWSLLRYPRSWPGWAFMILDCAWVLLWTFPAGLWAPTGRRLLAAMAIPASLSVLLSGWTPLESPGMLHAAACIAGALTGRAVRSAPSRHPPFPA